MASAKLRTLLDIIHKKLNHMNVVLCLANVPKYADHCSGGEAMAEKKIIKIQDVKIPSSLTIAGVGIASYAWKLDTETRRGPLRDRSKRRKAR